MKDRTFVWISIGLIALAVSVPFRVGLLLTPPGYMWHGLSFLNPGDPSVYYSYIEQGRQGHFSMTDVFTSERQTFPVLQPWWWWLGQVARLTGLSSIAIFSLARLLLIPLLAWTLWWAAAWIFSSPGERRIGYGLALVGGGLGGFIALFYAPVGIRSWPDLWVAEAYPVLTMMSSPHFLLVTIGILLTIIGVERSWHSGRWSWAVLGGFGALLATSLHPFHVVTWIIYAGIRLVMIAWQDRRRLLGYIGRWAVAVGIASPALLWFAIQITTDPLAQARSAQNINTTAHPILLLVSLGLTLPFAMITVWQRRRHLGRLGPVLALAIAYLLAVYVPVLWQRRLSHGLFIPWAWLAAPTVWTLWQRVKTWSPRSVMAAIVITLFFIVSPLWTMTAIVRDYWTERVIGQRFVYFLSPEQQALAAAIRARSDIHRPILASYTNGRVLAGLTGHQVFIAHAVETIHFGEKQDELENFFSRWSQDEQQTWLAAKGLCYILDSPGERAYGSNFHPADWTNLRLVWHSPTTRLYEVSDCI